MERSGLRDRYDLQFEPTLEARAEEMLAFIMPCEEEEDEVNRQKESKRWQNVNPLNIHKFDGGHLLNPP